MKKLFTLCFIIFCVHFVSFSQEVIDFEGKSFDELILIQKELNKAIWNTKEWKKVFVPAGVYKIGVDIPAGRWSVESDEKFADIRIYKKYVEGKCEEQVSRCPLTKGQGTVDLIDGCYLYVWLGADFRPYTNLFSFE